MLREYKQRICLLLIVLISMFAPRLYAESPDGWLAMGEMKIPEIMAPLSLGLTPPEEPRKGPPLPPHNIEGVGGCLITPMAYLVNPGPEGTKVGLPAVSFSFMDLGHKKNVTAFAVTQTFFRRFELGYSVSRFDLGNLPNDVSNMTGFHIGRSDVYLHNFNLRAQLIEEDSFDLPLPAVTAGVHFKYNCGIRTIDNRTQGAFSAIGMERSNGVDFTLTATKTVPVFGRPVMLTAGLRNSQAAQIGYLGFADECQTTIETGVVCLVTDWLAVGYEFRQKVNPYDKIDGLIEDEDNWHAVVVGLVLSDNLTLCAAWGCLGNMANTDASGSWGLQLKYNF